MPREFTINRMYRVTSRWKLHTLGYQLLLLPTYSLDLARSEYFLLAYLNRLLAEKQFCTYEHVFAETEWKTEAYFEAEDKSDYTKKVYQKNNLQNNLQNYS